MELIKTKEAIDWLSQFIGVDHFLAKSLINSMHYISSTDFEEGIVSQIEEIKSHPKRKIALFPVIKKPNDSFNEGKEKRVQHGSEGRVAHSLTNIERQFPKKYIVTPTVNSMRAERISDIVLVDDLLGTGKRIRDSWRYSITTDEKLQKTIDSWLSYKVAKIWVVTYAAHTVGINLIKKLIKPLTRDSILFSQEVKAPPKWWKDEHDRLCIRYGKLTSRPRVPLGFGNLRSSVVFQHGCPNNCPAILWAEGKKWKALFPNRGIPTSLFNVFNELQPNNAIQSIFDSGQEKLALALLNHIHAKTIREKHLEILVVLGLLNKKVKVDNLTQYTSFNKQRVKKIINICFQSGLLKKHLKLTELAKEVLNRYKESKIEVQSETNSDVESEIPYLPTQLFGVPAKV